MQSNTSERYSNHSRCPSTYLFKMHINSTQLNQHQYQHQRDFRLESIFKQRDNWLHTTVSCLSADYVDACHSAWKGWNDVYIRNGDHHHHHQHHQHHLEWNSPEEIVWKVSFSIYLNLLNILSEENVNRLLSFIRWCLTSPEDLQKMFSKFSKIWSSLDSDSSDNEQQNHAGNNNNLNRRGSRNVLSSIIFNSNRGTTAPDNSETASAADAVISGSSSVTVHPRNDRTGVGSSSLHYSQSSAPRPTLASLESSCGPRSSHAPHLVNSSDSSRGVIRQHGTLQHHMHHNIIDLNDAEIESPTFDSEDIETQRSGSPASSSRRQVLSRYSPVFTSSSPHRPSIHQQISLPIHGSSNTRRTSLQPLQFRVASVHGRSSPNRRKSLTLYNQDNIVRHQRQLPSAPAPDNSRQRQVRR